VEGCAAHRVLVVPQGAVRLGRQVQIEPAAHTQSVVHGGAGRGGAGRGGAGRGGEGQAVSLCKLARWRCDGAVNCTNNRTFSASGRPLHCRQAGGA
jgi:hypothetical protein